MDTVTFIYVIYKACLCSWFFKVIEKLMWKKSSGSFTYKLLFGYITYFYLLS